MENFPEHRQIYLRVMIRAGAEATAEIRAHLITVLQRYGSVEVSGGEPYWKDPANLEFGVDLVPPGRVADCAAALRATSGGWKDCPGGTGWVQGAGPAFLHPNTDWATMDTEEAAHTRRYTSGEVVRILDCPNARAENLVDVEAEIRGYATPVSDDEVWGYAVVPTGWDTVVCFEEPELAPTGCRMPPPEPQPARAISVNPDGVITDSTGL